MDHGYSFIDVVALASVRGRFAAGEALAVLSQNLDEIIWANGAGAAALGFEAMEAAIGADNPLPAIARRQIEATPGFPHVEPNRTIVVRTAAARSSRLSRLSLEPVTLPDGENALLLSFLDHAAEPNQAHQQALAGFAMDDHMAAILDENGTSLASTPLFQAADLKPADLSELARSAAKAKTRVAKRHLASRHGPLPAGLAKLSDDPALFFLIAIGDGLSPHDATASTLPQTPAVAPLTDAPQNEAPQPSGDDPVANSALRFVWRTDAQGRFDAVSPEFLTAVGLNDDAVIGRSFRDLASDLGFDGDGEITGLLERRDTWSGRSVLWPLAGSTRLRAPVDLAALPVYDRDRAFTGFRGFGVARFADAVSADESVEADPVSHEPHADANDTLPDHAGDPFGGEPPALASAQMRNAEPPLSEEKVVRLAAHRQAAAEKAGLSSSERNAFQEIGHRLKKVEGVEEEAVEVAQQPASSAENLSPASAEPIAPDLPEVDEPFSEQAAALSDPMEESVAPSVEDASLQPAADLVSADDSADTAARAAVEGGWTRSPSATSVNRLRDGSLASFDEGVGAQAVGDEPPVLTDDAVSPSLDGAATAQELLSLERQEATGTEDAETSVDAAGEADDGAFVGIEPLGADAPAVLPEAETAAADASAENLAPSINGHDTAPANWEEEAAAAPGFSGPKLPEAERELIDALPIALIIHAGDRLDFANREFFSLTGFDSLSAISAAGGLEALFPAPMSTEPSADDRRLFVRRADGEQIPVHAHLQSVPWNGGKSLMLSLRRAEAEPQSRWSVLQDLRTDEPAPLPQSLGDNVTRLPLSLVPAAVQPVMAADPDKDEALARTQALVDEMRAIIDTATDGVVLITPDGLIRNLSQPAEALFAVDSAAVEGQPFSSLFAIESQRAIKDYLLGLTDHGVASVLNDGREVIGREKQGGFIPLFITIGRLPAQGGFCAVLREITQWKRAEEELTQARAQAERSSSQKSEFLARVSHEIRTPLNAIIGFSELMMEERFGPVGNDRYRDYLRDINRSGTHVLDLVNDLLDISKIEAGEQELSYTAVSLNDALAEAVAIMQPQANRERVIIRSSFVSRLPDVVADLRSIRQIALNLLSNAVRYTQAGGQVIVSTVYENTGEVILRIRDTGVGMSSAEIDQALRPFKQINALRRARGDGTGLGLPLTKAMVEANRARFVITSRPGDGTLVEITFPSTRVLAD